MREKIKELWLACEMGLGSYDTWGDDDLGRLQIIKERISFLIELRDKVKSFQADIKYIHSICE